jgi:hypothetical protein
MLEDTGTHTRRDFTQAAALALAGLAAGGAAAEQPEPKPPTETEALLLVMQARFGKHIEKEQLPALLAGITRATGSAARMKSVKLTNADEPAVIFRADLP